MSQINVNTIIPQSGDVVSLNSLNVRRSSGTVQMSNASNAITATNSTIIGSGAALDPTGSNVVAIGTNAGQVITTASSVVAIGSGAGSQINTGGTNVVIGANSGNFITSGVGNVCLGNNAGGTITTGNSNTFIGTGVGNGVASITGQNIIVIGNGADPASATASNSITLGNNAIGVLRCAVTSITSLSDARDKKEVEDLNVGLEFIDGLRPVKFVWDDRDENGKHDIADFGFIAQDLKEAEEAVEMADILKLVYDENPEKLEASYGKLIPILVKAVQELSAEVKALKAAK